MERIRTTRWLLPLLLLPFALVAWQIGYWAAQREPCYTIVNSDPKPNPAKVGDEIDLNLRELYT